jgi:hypothetical protein
MSSLDYKCFHCEVPVDDNHPCYKCACRRCGSNISDGFCKWCKENPNAFNDSQSLPDHPPQPQLSLFDQHHCYICRDLLEDGSLCKRCFCKECGFTHGLCTCCTFEIENTFTCPDFQNNFSYTPHNSFEQEPCYQDFIETSFQNAPNVSCAN